MQGLVSNFAACLFHLKMSLSGLLRTRQHVGQLAGQRVGKLLGKARQEYLRLCTGQSLLLLCLCERKAATAETETNRKPLQKQVT